MRKGSHHSEESKRKLSEAKKGKYTGEKNPFYGKRHSDETKRKIGESNKGKHHSHTIIMLKGVEIFG